MIKNKLSMTNTLGIKLNQVVKSNETNKEPKEIKSFLPVPNKFFLSF